MHTRSGLVYLRIRLASGDQQRFRIPKVSCNPVMVNTDLRLNENCCDASVIGRRRQ